MDEAADERTILFVDLAGFTALTESHGDEQAADLAEQFVELTQHSLGQDDRLIKSIGDAVMITSPSPAVALESLLRHLIQGFSPSVSSSQKWRLTCRNVFQRLPAAAAAFRSSAVPVRP